MSANGLEVFDKTLETTHIWLKEIMTDLGPDKQVAWKVLSTVLHKLRDRLSRFCRATYRKARSTM